ncbi:hypothetical protein HID58_046337, partial [Brassica napus]
PPRYRTDEVDLTLTVHDLIDSRHGTWDVQKIRHLFVEEDATTILGMKLNLQREDTMVWAFSKNGMDQDAAGDSTSTWQKPCPSFVKCNIGSSWVDGNQNCGVAWLTRNHAGAALAHSRRSYSHVSSALEAELLGFYWASESVSTMRYEKMVFESTSYLAGEAILKPGNFPQWLSLIEAIREKLSLLRLWSISYVNRGANRCADAIALSVTRDQRYASYIATDCPGWLLPIVREDESGIFSAH